MSFITAQFQANKQPSFMAFNRRYVSGPAHPAKANNMCPTIGGFQPVVADTGVSQ